MAADEVSSNDGRKVDNSNQGTAQVIPLHRSAATDGEALAIFSKIAKHLLGPGDLKTTFDAFTQHAVELSGAEYGGYFFNENGTWGLLSLVGAPIEAFSKFPTLRITPLFKPTYDGHTIVRSDDIATDPRYGKMGGPPPGHVPVRSYLAVPVLSGPGETHGTLLLAHSQPARFTAKIESRIADVASMAQVALERDAREREAKEVRGMLGAIAEAAPQAIYAKDMEGNVTYANQALLDVLGLERDEVVHRHTLTFLQADVVNVTKRVDSRVFETDVVVQEPVTVTRRDGKVITLLTHKKRMLDHTGKPVGLIAVATDITDLTRYQEELRESERVHRELLDALPVALYTTALDGTVLYYNQAAIDFAGYTPPEGQKWSVAWKLLDGNDQPMKHEDCPMAIALRYQRSVRGIEAKAVRPDGKIVSFLPHPTPLHDGKGNVTGAVNVMVDITERREMEQRLRESEDHYRNMIELTPHVAFTCDPEGNITSHSSKWFDITGQKEGETLIEAGWQRALHPSDVSRFVDDLHVSMATGQPLDCEFRVLSKLHSDYRWYRSRAYPRRNEAGAIIRWYGVMEDVHDHYTDRQKLTISEERFGLATNAAKIGVWDWEPVSGRVVFSEQNEALFGFEPGQFDGTITTWRDLILPDDLEATDRLCEAEFDRRSGSFEMAYRIVRPNDKQPRHICAISRVFYNDQGAPVRVVGTCTDITDRTLARVALADSERRLQATHDSAGVGIAEVDTTGRYLRANTVWAKLSGREPEAFIGKSYFDFIDDPVERAETIALFDKVVRGDIPSFMRQRSYARPNGQVWWAEVTTTAVRDERGRFLYAVKVAQDVTERRNAEDEERMLMGELNHRVKNTLATIQSLCRQSIRSADNLQEFEVSFTGRLTAIEATHAVLMKTNWSGGATLADVVRAELKPYHGEKSLRWAGFGPPMVLNSSAAVYVGMILHELTTNAVKYGALGEDGGRVDVLWHLEDRDGIEYLTLDWTESEGPAVTVPKRTGFGTKLLKSIGQQFGGTVEIDYAKDGVEAHLAIPSATLYKTHRNPKAAEKSFQGV